MRKSHPMRSTNREWERHLIPTQLESTMGGWAHLTLFPHTVLLSPSCQLAGNRFRFCVRKHVDRKRERDKKRRTTPPKKKKKKQGWKTTPPTPGWMPHKKIWKMCICTFLRNYHSYFRNWLHVLWSVPLPVSVPLCL